MKAFKYSARVQIWYTLNGWCLQTSSKCFKEVKCSTVIVYKQHFSWSNLNLDVSQCLVRSVYCFRHFWQALLCQCRFCTTDDNLIVSSCASSPPHQLSSQLTSLELQYVSPKLLMCRDLELAVPGTYDPNQPIIRIQSIAPSLQVITSKQRPRKLTIMGKIRRKLHRPGGSKLIILGK